MDGTFEVIAITRYLAVETKGRRPGTDARGVVLAVGWWQPAETAASASALPNARAAAPPSMFYLVSDVSRAAPVWIPEAQLTRQIAHVPFDAPAPASDDGQAEDRRGRRFVPHSA